jgi:death on curing protein
MGSATRSPRSLGARPRHRWSYRPGADPVELAAAYAFGFMSNHPYMDGNERVALVALVAFLDLNDVVLTATHAGRVSAMQAVSAGARTAAATSR